MEKTRTNTTDVTEDVQVDVTEDVQADVTEDETASVTENVTTPVCCDTVAFRYESDKYDNVEKPSVTTGVTGYATDYVTANVTSHLTANVTTFVTRKEETKQKKEEFPPAPPIEEKKQKKERNNLTPAHACEKNSTENLEIRRLRFIDTLHLCVERYGEEMIRHFGEYRTEENRSLTHRSWGRSF